MPSDEIIAAITRDQLRGAVVGLEGLADKLERFRSGDNDAWTDTDTLAGHSLLTIIASHVAVTRNLRVARERASTVISLDGRR